MVHGDNILATRHCRREAAPLSVRAQALILGFSELAINTYYRR